MDIDVSPPGKSTFLETEKARGVDKGPEMGLGSHVFNKRSDLYLRIKDTKSSGPPRLQDRIMILSKFGRTHMDD